MKICSVFIRNINSLKGDHLLSFEDRPLGNAGLIAISGPTGAGKSTILDAICLALYNQNPRGTEANATLMTQGTAECRAEVVWTAHQHRYRAAWSCHRSRKDPNGKPQPPKRELARFNPETQSFDLLAEMEREVAPLIREITGLTYSQFTRAILLAQGDFAAFLKADKKERGVLLEQITGAKLFSEISMMAYRRWQESEQQTQELKRELERCQLLSPEQMAALQQEIQQAEQTIGQAEQQQIKWMEIKVRAEQLAQLRTREQQLQARTGQLAAAQEAFAPDALRLERHRQAHPHQPLLEAIESLRAEQEQLSAQTARLHQTQETANRQAQSFELAAEQARAHLQTVQQEQTQKEEWLLKTILPIEQQLALLQRRREELLGQHQTFSTAHQTRKNTLAHQQTALENLRQQQQTISAWLEQHRPWQQLPALLLSAKERLEQWQQARTELAGLEKTHSNTRLHLAEIQKKRAEAEARSQQLGQECARLHTLLLEKQQQAEAAPPALQLQQESDRLRAQLGQWNEALAVARQAVQLQQELSHTHALVKEQAGALALQEAHIGTLHTRQVAAQEQLALLVRLYEAEKAVAGYEEARRTLAAGEPCPLCGALDHPYAQHLPQPRPKDALAKKQEQEKEISRLAELLRQAEKDRATQLAALESEKVRAELKARQLEQASARIRTALSAETPPTLAEMEAQINSLTAQSAHVQERLSELARLQKEAQAAQEAHRQAEERLRSAEKALQELVRQTDLAAQQYEHAAGQVQALSTQTETTATRIRQAIEPFSRWLTHPEDFAAALAQLQQFATRWQEQETALRPLPEQIAALQTSAEAVQAQLATEAAELDRIRQEGTQVREQIEAARQQRIRAIGEMSVEQALEQVRSRTAQAMQAAQQTTDRLQQARQQQNAAKEALLAAEKQAHILQERADRLQNRWQQEAAPQGWLSGKQLKEALLSTPEAEQLANRAESLRKEAEAIQQEQASLSEQVATLLKQEEVGLPLQEVLEQVRSATETFKTRQEELARLRQQEARQLESQQEARQLAEKLEQHLRQANLLAKLKTLIGSADGQLFRNFAQEITLEYLCQIANHYLHQISDRYQIRPTGSELSLEVADSYQAGHIRPMNSLSGGESFLVSLALALGLSAFSSRFRTIGSLFIDEGFGTLDPASLETALSALENLQAGGRQVFVVSHVTALNERITSRIRVLKGTQGFSRVQVE